MRVLVVEDEVKLAKLVRQGLREEGLLADVAVTGEDALWMAAATPYDVIVLDVNLPGIDGFETCRRLRTERRGHADPHAHRPRRRGRPGPRLDTGADDYLVKPFDFGELLARLRALARRRPPSVQLLEVGDLDARPPARRGPPRRDGDRVSVKEFQLLEVFMRHPGRPSPATAARGRLGHGLRAPLQRRDVYVRYLREKIDRPFGRDTRDGARRRLPPARPLSVGAALGVAAPAIARQTDHLAGQHQQGDYHESPGQGVRAPAPERHHRGAGAGSAQTREERESSVFMGLHDASIGPADEASMRRV